MNTKKPTHRIFYATEVIKMEDDGYRPPEYDISKLEVYEMPIEDIMKKNSFKRLEENLNDE